MDILQEVVDKLYREHFGKLVSSLLYASRAIDPEAAEDIVHDTFSAALADWRENGQPINGAAWLYKVCRNKALNRIRKLNREEALDTNKDYGWIENRFSESMLDDHQLKLLFASAHPDLAPKVQVVIALKYVANLKVEAIAKVLAMTVDGVDKLLLRARQKIKDEKILLHEPDPSAFSPRLASVHKIIYLIFNEGYKSSRGEELIREELCEEALLLNNGLLNSPLHNQDTIALQALMLFNISRFKSRFSPSGDLLDLESQDRALWDKELIALASNFLLQSGGHPLSAYHLEASIACLHCAAPTFTATNWTLIAKLYVQLLDRNPSPFVELNYAIAMYYAGNKSSAFSILNDLQRHPFLGQYYLLNATLGKFYYLEGDTLIAGKYLEAALQQTQSVKEKELLQKMRMRFEGNGMEKKASADIFRYSTDAN